MYWKTLQKVILICLMVALPFFASCCVHSQNQNPFFGSHTLRKAKKSVVKIDCHTTIEWLQLQLM